MPKGDVVLVNFPFTDLSVTKLRSAVVWVDNTIDFTLSFITTQIGRQQPTDVLLLPSVANGIKKNSLIRTNKIAMLNYTLVKGLFGRLSAKEITELNTKLKVLFQLP